jgi:hypothetical protein
MFKHPINASGVVDGLEQVLERRIVTAAHRLNVAIALIVGLPQFGDHRAVWTRHQRDSSPVPGGSETEYSPSSPHERNGPQLTGAVIGGWESRRRRRRPSPGMGAASVARATRLAT